MSTGTVRRYWLAVIPVLALAFPSVLLAQGIMNPPVGNIPFDLTNNRIVFLSGASEIGLPIFNDAIPMTFDMDMKGNITGIGSVDTTISPEGSPISIHVDFTMKGKLKMKDGVGKVTMKFKGIGVADGTIPVTVTANLKGDMDYPQDTMAVTMDVKACGKGKGCLKEKKSESGGFPKEIIKHWDVNMDLTMPNEKTVMGTAEVDVSMDGSKLGYTFSVKGKYDPKKDESTLQLKRAGGGSIKITHFRVYTFPVPGYAGDVSYDLFGQKGVTSIEY